MPEVVFLARILMHYRVPFHEAVRQRLAARGVNYRVLYGRPRSLEAQKGGLAELTWGELADNHYFGPGEKLVWQDVLSSTKGADLVIIGQENAILSNYVLQFRRIFGGPRLAYFGHGRNFQATSPDGGRERFKRLWISQVDWWFAYTERSAEIVAAAGFPRHRITAFNNAIDTAQMREEVRQLHPDRVAELRQQLVQGSRNVGVYVGGLYPEKRVPFLLQAALRIRQLVPDFHLIVLGGGEDAGLVERAAADWPWLHYVGPRFGMEKTETVALASVFLMPGLVGLSVLDAFVYGLPMITTDIPSHSPEFAYLRNGENGLVVRPADDIDAYAAAVAGLLNDPVRQEELARNASESAHARTIESMADHFVDGMMKALSG